MLRDREFVVRQHKSSFVTIGVSSSYCLGSGGANFGTSLDECDA